MNQINPEIQLHYRKESILDPKLLENPSWDDMSENIGLNMNELLDEELIAISRNDKDGFLVIRKERRIRHFLFSSVALSFKRNEVAEIRKNGGLIKGGVSQYGSQADQENEKVLSTEDDERTFFFFAKTCGPRWTAQELARRGLK